VLQFVPGGPKRAIDQAITDQRSPVSQIESPFCLASREDYHARLLFARDGDAYGVRIIGTKLEDFERGATELSAQSREYLLNAKALLHQLPI
jgi:hypothetical protein